MVPAAFDGYAGCFGPLSRVDCGIVSAETIRLESRTTRIMNRAAVGPRGEPSAPRLSPRQSHPSRADSRQSVESLVHDLRSQSGTRSCSSTWRTYCSVETPSAFALALNTSVCSSGRSMVKVMEIIPCRVFLHYRERRARVRRRCCGGFL